MGLRKRAQVFMTSFDLKFISVHTGLPPQSEELISIFALDEVGRGPLAGPVVSGCIHGSGTTSELKAVLKFLKKIKVTDSKKLTKVERESICRRLNIDLENLRDKIPFSIELNGMSLKICLVEIDNYKIDEINILQASLQSMKMAFELLWQENKVEKSLIMVDGNKLFDVPLSVKAISIIEGDARSLFIGLASIVAKVYRDRLMDHFDKIYPGYDFSRNAGYPTESHRLAIKNLGPTAIHRTTFSGVKEYVGTTTRK